MSTAGIALFAVTLAGLFISIFVVVRRGNLTKRSFLFIYVIAVLLCAVAGLLVVEFDGGGIFLVATYVVLFAPIGFIVMARIV